MPSAQGQPAGEMNVALHFTMSPTWVDPAETPGIITPFLMLYAIHDALVKPMPEGLMTPSLAESWTVSEDGRIYEFRLRQGLTFHNGEPLLPPRMSNSASSVIKARAPRRCRAACTTWRSSIRIWCASTSGPLARLHDLLGHAATGAAWIVSKKYLAQVGDEGFKRHPIGLGPYKFVSKPTRHRSGG